MAPLATNEAAPTGDFTFVHMLSTARVEKASLAAYDGEQALNTGLNPMIFSDTVSKNLNGSHSEKPVFASTHLSVGLCVL